VVKQDKLPFRLSFRCDDPTLEGLEELSIKLGMGQSEVLRIAVKKLMETYLNIKGDVIVMSRPEFDKIVNEFADKVTKQSIKSLDSQRRDVMEIITNLLKQPGVKEALKSVKREDIEINEKK